MSHVFRPFVRQSSMFSEQRIDNVLDVLKICPDHTRSFFPKYQARKSSNKKLDLNEKMNSEPPMS